MNEDRAIFLDFREARVKAEPLSQNVVKVGIFKGDKRELEKDRVDEATPKRQEIEDGWAVEVSPKKFSIFKDDLEVAEFEKIEFSYPEWARSTTDPTSDEGSWSSFKHRVGKKSKIFGLGEKTGYLEKSGSRYEMWNTDPGGRYRHNQDPIYCSIPFYIVVKGDDDSDMDFVGLYLDQPERSKFDVKYQAGFEYVGVSVNEEHLSFYIFLGDDLEGVVEEYTDLTGMPFMPPKWALGYHQSKYGKPRNEREAIELAREFRERKIPCDALYFDIQYMDDYRLFTWDSEGFPNPKNMIKKLHEMGFKVVNIIDPGVKVEDGYDVYDSGLEIDAFLRSENGESYEGAVWPGFCVFPDFLRREVRGWWADQHRILFDDGVDGIWNDMNEPSIFFGKEEIQRVASDVLDKIDEGKEMSIGDLARLQAMPHSSPEKISHRDDEGSEVSHERVHNVYALYEAQATNSAFMRHASEKRPFILTRAGFSGIQKYAAVWTGDNSSTWEHMGMSISMALNLGLSGVPLVGADIGGFHGNVEPELLTRWIQLGAFLPFFRNHSTLNSIDQEPWAFGEPFEKINRRFIELRYRLLPYLYTLSYQAHEKGIPIARPLFMEFPGDETSYSIQDEFMLGSSLLVSPVLERHTEKIHVYLPYENGDSLEWEDWWTGEILRSGHRIVDSPLEKIPLFIREDAGLPLSEPVSSTEREPKELVLRGNLKSGFGVPIYHDDGETRAHEGGDYFYGEFVVEEKDDSIHVSLDVKNDGYQPFWESVELDLRGRGEKVTSSPP